MSIVPEDPQFLSNNDEWLSEADSRRQAALAQSAEHSPCKREVAGSTPAGSTTPFEDGIFNNNYSAKEGISALVAQRSEQDAHNVLVGGSNPSEGTIFFPEESLTITDHEERAAVYEQALREIISITRVESPLDRSAESFFFVASKMRKLAIAAMKRTGART